MPRPAEGEGYVTIPAIKWKGPDESGLRSTGIPAGFSGHGGPVGRPARRAGRLPRQRADDRADVRLLVRRHRPRVAGVGTGARPRAGCGAVVARGPGRPARCVRRPVGRPLHGAGLARRAPRALPGCPARPPGLRAGGSARRPAGGTGVPHGGRAGAESAVGRSGAGRRRTGVLARRVRQPGRRTGVHVLVGRSLAAAPCARPDRSDRAGGAGRRVDAGGDRMAGDGRARAPAPAARASGGLGARGGDRHRGSGAGRGRDRPPAGRAGRRVLAGAGAGCPTRRAPGIPLSTSGAGGAGGTVHALSQRHAGRLVSRTVRGQHAGALPDESAPAAGAGAGGGPRFGGRDPADARLPGAPRDAGQPGPGGCRGRGGAPAAGRPAGAGGSASCPRLGRCGRVSCRHTGSVRPHRAPHAAADHRGDQPLLYPGVLRPLPVPPGHRRCAGGGTGRG